MEQNRLISPGRWVGRTTTNPIPLPGPGSARAMGLPSPLLANPSRPDLGTLRLGALASDCQFQVFPS